MMRRPAARIALFVVVVAFQTNLLFDGRPRPWPLVAMLIATVVLAAVGIYFSVRALAKELRQ